MSAGSVKRRQSEGLARFLESEDDMAGPPSSQKAITAERIEAALNAVARYIVELGAEGPVMLPIYDRLERELAILKGAERKMAEIYERAGKSRRRDRMRK